MGLEHLQLETFFQDHVPIASIRYAPLLGIDRGPPATGPRLIDKI